MNEEAVEIRRGVCPECGANKRAEVVAKHKSSWSDDEFMIYGTIDFRILSCLGCETVYVQKIETFSEDREFRYNPVSGEEESYLPETVTYWPSTPRRQFPEWFGLHLAGEDPTLYYLLEELYAAVASDQRVLAAIGIRTVVDRSSELLGIDPTEPFAKKLDELKAKGFVGAAEKIALEVLIDAGSAAAHRGWRPKLDDVFSMLDLLEGFLKRNFVDQHRIRELKVPPKPAKGKKPTGP